MTLQKLITIQMCYVLIDFVVYVLAETGIFLIMH